MLVSEPVGGRSRATELPWFMIKPGILSHNWQRIGWIARQTPICIKNVGCVDSRAERNVNNLHFVGRNFLSSFCSHAWFALDFVLVWGVDYWGWIYHGALRHLVCWLLYPRWLMPRAFKLGKSWSGGWAFVWEGAFGGGGGRLGGGGGV